MLPLFLLSARVWHCKLLSHERAGILSEIYLTARPTVAIRACPQPRTDAGNWSALSKRPCCLTEQSIVVAHRRPSISRGVVARANTAYGGMVTGAKISYFIHAQRSIGLMSPQSRLSWFATLSTNSRRCPLNSYITSLPAHD